MDVDDIDDLEAEDLDSMGAGDVTRMVKCLVVGNGHVGKSTYVRRFCQGKYDDEYRKTIGCVFGERRGFRIRSYPFNQHVGPRNSVDVWVCDTAGQEEYRELTQKYYTGAGCVLLLFSTRDRSSLQNLSTWRSKVIELCGREVPMCIVQTKVDAEDANENEDDSPIVTPTEAKNAAREMGLKLFRVSSKKGTGVDEPIEYVVSICLSKGGGDAEQSLQHISIHKAAAVESKSVDITLRNAGSSDDDEDDNVSEKEFKDEKDDEEQRSNTVDEEKPSHDNHSQMEQERANKQNEKEAERDIERKRQESEFQRKREELKRANGGGCCIIS